MNSKSLETACLNHDGICEGCPVKNECQKDFNKQAESVPAKEITEPPIYIEDKGEAADKAGMASSVTYSVELESNMIPDEWMEQGDSNSLPRVIEYIEKHEEPDHLFRVSRFDDTGNLIDFMRGDEFIHEKATPEKCEDCEGCKNMDSCKTVYNGAGCTGNNHAPLCDSCSAIVLQGLLCHEYGCPNTGK